LFYGENKPRLNLAEKAPNLISQRRKGAEENFGEEVLTEAQRHGDHSEE